MKIKYIASALGCALIAGSAFAAPATLTTTVMQEKISRNAAGQVVSVLAPHTQITPGDQVVYVLTYSNHSAKPATGVVITNKVPDGVEFAGPGDGPAPLLSIGADNFVTLGQLTAGKAQVSMADVTAVRWVLTDAVPAGGQARISFHAKVK